MRLPQPEDAATADDAAPAECGMLGGQLRKHEVAQDERKLTERDSPCEPDMQPRIQRWLHDDSDTRQPRRFVGRLCSRVSPAA